MIPPRIELRRDSIRTREDVEVNNDTKFVRLSTESHGSYSTVIYFDKYTTRKKAKQSSFQIYQFDHRHQQAVHNIFQLSLLTNKK